jgi:type VII secretion protein EccE
LPANRATTVSPGWRRERVLDPADIGEVLTAEPGTDPAQSRAAVDVASLARAVVRAADLGARVINISAVTCLPANKPIDQTELGAALKYAAVQKDAVIVAAAGDNRGGLATGSACESNPLTDPARPGDPRNWASVDAKETWRGLRDSSGFLAAYRVDGDLAELRALPSSEIWTALEMTGTADDLRTATVCAIRTHDKPEPIAGAKPLNGRHRPALDALSPMSVERLTRT